MGLADILIAYSTPWMPRGFSSLWRSLCRFEPSGFRTFSHRVCPGAIDAPVAFNSPSRFHSRPTLAGDQGTAAPAQLLSLAAMLTQADAPAMPMTTVDSPLLDILIFGAFVATTMVIVLRASWNKKTATDSYAAGRSRGKRGGGGADGGRLTDRARRGEGGQSVIRTGRLCGKPRLRAGPARAGPFHGPDAGSGLVGAVPAVRTASARMVG